MKAILVNEETKTLYLGDAEKPNYKEDELLIKVKATALNRADLLQKQGLYPPPKGASPILGLEASGVVEEVGEKVTDWQVGDRVFSLLPGGGYAEYATIPANMAMRIPDHLSFEEAAAIPEVFLTAFLNLFNLGGLQKGYDVLVHAGASGVGTAAIQLIREAGATSIVTAGTEEKRQACKDLGASVAIDYKAGPFASKVKDATNDQGVNLILDFIGAPYFKQNLDVLKMDGRLVIIGTMGGTNVEDVNLGYLLGKRLQVIGTALRSRTPEEKAALTKQFSDFALKRFSDGRLKPIIDSVWAWEQAQQAQEHMEANKNTGKIILKINA